MKTNIDLGEDLHKIGVPLVGISSKDHFPSVPRRNGGYVINLDDDRDSRGNVKSGTHWVGLYVENKRAAYFDSFSFPPPRQVHEFLKPFRPYIINDLLIQNVLSGVCGSYVVFFLWWMNRHRELPFDQRYRAFVGLFSDDPKKNRSILEKHLDKLKIRLYE